MNVSPALTMAPAGQSPASRLTGDVEVSAHGRDRSLGHLLPWLWFGASYKLPHATAVISCPGTFLLLTERVSEAN